MLGVLATLLADASHGEGDAELQAQTMLVHTRKPLAGVQRATGKV